MLGEIAVFGGLAVLMLVLMCVLVGVLVTAFWIWMLVSAASNKGVTEGEKIAWILVVVLLHLLGAIVYFFAAHSKRNTPLATT